MTKSPHHADIPKVGKLVLEDGEIIVRRDDGQEFGRLMVGPEGLYYNGGEITNVQTGDPPKFRVATFLNDGHHKGLGAISFNVMRPDGKQEECGFIKVDLDEDVQLSSAGTPDEYRGKLQINLRARSSEDPRPVVVWSQYRSVAKFGFRTFYTAAIRALGSLWVHAPSGEDVTPYCGASGGGSVPPHVTRFYSDDNHYAYNVQGDPTPDFPHGRIVQYSVDPTTGALTPVAILRPEPL